MATPKKPIKKIIDQSSGASKKITDQPVDSKAPNKFLDDEEDEFDLPLDDIGGIDDFNDFDDDDDDDF